MKYRCLLLTFVLALLSRMAIASDVMLTMNSYGPVKIGMTADEAFTHLRSIGQANKPNVGEDCDYYDATPGVSFMLNHKSIVRIEVSSEEVVTPSGIRVGDSISELKKVFGSRLDDQPNHYDIPAARTIKLFSNDKKIAMRFEVYENKIQEIYSGYEHSIHYVEGCS